jgi:hypothetical protein
VSFNEDMNEQAQNNDSRWSYRTSENISLRDWFAGLAMQASIAHGGAFSYAYLINGARDAYKMADAMLEARNEQQEKEAMREGEQS